MSARLAAVKHALPRGGLLPDSVWLARHRGICLLLWCQVVALAAIAVVRGDSLARCVIGPAIVAMVTVAASRPSFGRNTRSSLATLGLLSCSAALIDLFDGAIEAHFHFFIVIAVVSLYQAWWPYLIAVGYVLVHHLVLGTLLPSAVYNHHMAVAHPWLFAAIHAGAVLTEAVACLVSWRVNEDALDAERANAEALELSNTELTQANRSVEDLVGMLSHDLRVPLTVVMGYSEMATESWSQMSEEDQLDYVRKVSEAGLRMKELLEDTLAVSALDAAGVQARRVPVRVDEAVRSAIEALPGAAPVVDLSRLAAATAEVDRGHLDQVLHNLLSNAVKYGGGSFAVTTREDAARVVVRITDAGPGVPPGFVPHLFDRYTRSEEARLGVQKGTGLGLYITQSLLIANSGAIHYRPNEAGGSTFCVHLPRASDALPDSVVGASPTGVAA